MLRKTQKYNSLEALSINTKEVKSLSINLQMILELVKFKITVLVSLTTALGYFLATRTLDFNFLYPIIGIFLLACSSAALNQLQEFNTDKQMDRTKNRPLPSGKISIASVLMLIFILFISGTLILLIKTNFAALITGLITFLWYNAVYTPLKRKTALAIIPGSVVGALPPVAGWFAGGGNLYSLDIYIIAIYFFVWQIPHFWLLVLLYSKDYKEGGFPVLNDIYSNEVIKKITFILLIATVLIGTSIVIAGINHYTLSSTAIFFISAAMIYLSFQLIRTKAIDRKNIIKTFVSINIYTLLIITILSADKLFYLL